MIEKVRESLPEQEPPEPTLNQQSAGEDDPVHEPWLKEGRVRRVESLVGGEDGEEEGGYGA